VDTVTVTGNLDMTGDNLSITAESITVNSGVTITANDITFNASATDAGLLGGWLNEIYQLTFADDVVLANADATIDLTGATLDGNNITLKDANALELDDVTAAAAQTANLLNIYEKKTYFIKNL
jgi:hypothetical protein